MDPAVAAIPYRRNRRMPAGVRLWLAVVVANVLGLFVATFGANAIRAVPDTAAIENALRAGYYLMMLIVAFIDALWLDEVVFKGSFRLQYLSGRSVDIARRQGDVQAMAALLRRSSASFPLSVLVCLAATYFAFNTVNHDFERYWKWVGQHVSALRGDDEEGRQRRLDAIDALSSRREKEVLPHLLRALGRPGEVGAWSAWAIGRHRDVKHARALVEPLVAAYRGEDPARRREALLSLGRLQHRPMADELQAALEAEIEAGGEVDTRLLWALGYVQHTSSLPLLERALYHRDPEVARTAAWALAQHRDQVDGRAAVALLEAALPASPFLVRCAIVHSLGITADERSNPALMHAMDAARPEERAAICPSLQIQVRPDRAGDRQDLLMPAEEYGLKILQSMGQLRATTPEMRQVVEPWLEALIADEQSPYLTREGARSLLAGVREG
jgi:HEAT repeat protein